MARNRFLTPPQNSAQKTRKRKGFGLKMVEGEAEPPRLHGGGHHFPVGSLVEVQDDEEEGVYFSATVVSSRRGSSCRNSEKVWVKYHDLLARENGPDRLTESVHISHVRPAPPQQADCKRFEPNDVVDAFYKDGWWKGVVSRVVEGGEGFVVTFENPPDVRQFETEALRPHWDWVDGVWIGPRKLIELGFEVGEKVEVSLERDADSMGAWIPATIVEISGKGAYFVEMKDENGACVKAEADFAQLRPRPPALLHINFGALERVDAFFKFRWWSGLIMNKVEKDGYNVLLEHLKSNKVLNQWEVRAHMVWKDGRWFFGSNSTALSSSRKRRKSAGDDHWGSRRKRTARPRHIRCGALKRHKNQTEGANQETEPLAVEKVVVPDGDPMMGVESVLVRGDEQQSEDLQTPSLTGTTKELCEPQSLGTSVVVYEARNKHAILETEEDMAIEKFVRDEDCMTGEENAIIQVGEEQNEDIQTPYLIDGSRSSLAPQSLISSVLFDGGQNKHAILEAEEDMAIEKFTSRDEGGMMGAENALAQVGEELNEDTRTPSLIDGSKAQSLMSSAVIDEGDMMPYSEWPFVKRNVAWKAIESMEVFRRIPQKPHFHPLLDFKETAREGMAIGFMVTFSNMVERSCSLKVDDPKSDMEDISQTLIELEAHGFDVRMVKSHVMKMLGAKDEVEKLMHEARHIKDQILEHKDTKNRMDKRISAIKGHLTRLQAHLELLQIDQANEVQQIAHFEAELDQNLRQINDLRSGFEAVATSFLCSR